MGVWAPRPVAAASDAPAAGLRSSHPSSDPDAALLVRSLPVLALGVVLLLGCVKRSRKNSHRRDSTTSVQDDGTIIVRGGVDLAPYLWKLSRVFGDEVVDEPKIPGEIPRFQISFTNELCADSGIETNIQIYEGWYDCGAEVAPAATLIKTAAMDDDELVDELLFEAVVTRQFKHSNVIKMLGVATVSDPYCIIYKHCPQGSLLEVLKGRGEMDVTYQEKINYCIGIAKGMQHVADLGYIHRDLACRTILVGAHNQPVIADFGPVRMSRVLLSGRKRSARDYRAISPRSPDHVIAVAWSAPEVITQQHFSLKSDVFSFGITIFEIFLSGAPPFGSKDMAAIEADIVASRPPGKPLNCPTLVYSYMKRCLKGDPDERPTFKTLVRDLLDVSAKHKRKAASSVWISSVTGIPVGDSSLVSTGSRAQGSLPTPPPPRIRRSSLEMAAELVPEQWMATEAAQNPLTAARVSAKDVRTASATSRGSTSSNNHFSANNRPGSLLAPPSRGASSHSSGSRGSARSGRVSHEDGYMRKSEMAEREDSRADVLYSAANDPLYVDPIVPEQALLQIELSRRHSEFEVSWDNRRIRESEQSSDDAGHLRTNESNYGNMATARLDVARGRVDVHDGEEYAMVLLPPETVTAHGAVEQPMSAADAEAFQGLVRGMAQPSDARNFVCPFTGARFFNGDELAAHLRARECGVTGQSGPPTGVQSGPPTGVQSGPPTQPRPPTGVQSGPPTQPRPPGPDQSRQRSLPTSFHATRDPERDTATSAIPEMGDTGQESAWDSSEESPYIEVMSSGRSSPAQRDAVPQPAPAPSPPLLRLLLSPLAERRPTIDLTGDDVYEGEQGDADYVC